ncbi:MAG: hypothetical protein M1834_008214 [Cirrosporium novae-zelandiae]|nr:MAG: hypothetical protein M1834_008214 [Cirrosporium novae-zelandiae]
MLSSINTTFESPRASIHEEPGPSTEEIEASFRNSTGYGHGAARKHTIKGIEVMCGPLLNYKGMRLEPSNRIVWHGSILIVVKPTWSQPTLNLRCLGPLQKSQEEIQSASPDAEPHLITGRKLYEDPAKAFFRFEIDIPIQHFEAQWEYTLDGVSFQYPSNSPNPQTRRFYVPARTQSMRIMFSSCNGFSVGTDLPAFSGPGGVLWKDVMRVHEQRPFHVMIGGGDQIYNDGVRVTGPLKAWTDIGNPARRRHFPFPATLRDECDEFYFKNYTQWYSLEPFATANSQIPQINIWDDHDIIDGFGSYTDHFMRCPVFRGIGGVSHKYYCLFQHHIAPPVATFTTDAPQTMTSQGINGPGIDPNQLQDTYVYTEQGNDPSFILGQSPGPYVEERSRSLYMQLGARVAFIGIDARTERTRHQVNYPETYELIFQRLETELTAAKGTIKHLILLLGVPIAYPRLVWLENIFSSPIIGPMRFLNRRFGLGGSFFNHFDGQVDLLDDLDDHYTARNHKEERRVLMQRLQKLAQDHGVRVTILGGDVHLGAMGRFYSKLSLGIPTERDHRYMVNIISSAITNKPPPSAIANLLARRNKIHHLDDETDETLMNLFDKDPGNSTKTAAKNHCTLPSRNYAVISEVEAPTIYGSNNANGYATGLANEALDGAANSKPKNDDFTPAENGHQPLHIGEVGAGTTHPTSNALTLSSMIGGLDICLKVEIDPRDSEGITEGYGFSIPALQATAGPSYGK